MRHLDEIFKKNSLFFLEGLFNLKPENRRRTMVNQERHPVLLPHLPTPSTPPSSTFNLKPPPQTPPLSDSEGHQDSVNSDGVSPSNTPPPVEENIKVQTQEPHLDDVPLTGDAKLLLDSVGSACAPSPPSRLSDGSLSDLSGPPSRASTRSTKQSGWISVSAHQDQDHAPSSSGCGLSSPFCQHRSPNIPDYFSSSFTTQQIAGPQTQNPALSHPSSCLC